MKAKNQNNKFIQGKDNLEKIKHMICNGYRSITIGKHIVEHKETLVIDGEDVIIVNVGGIDD